MPYLGKEPVRGSFKTLDTIVPNGSSSYSLLFNGSAYDPGQAARLIVSVNGVTQAPNIAYTVSGNTITFTAAVTSSDVIDYIVGMGDVYDVGSVSDGTITPAKLASTLVLDDTPIRTNLNTLDNAVTVAANQNAFVAGPVTINAPLTVNGTFTVI
jgi:hypothetical protein